MKLNACDKVISLGPGEWELISSDTDDSTTEQEKTHNSFVVPEKKERKLYFIRKIDPNDVLHPANRKRERDAQSKLEDSPTKRSKMVFETKSEIQKFDIPYELEKRILEDNINQQKMSQLTIEQYFVDDGYTYADANRRICESSVREYSRAACLLFLNRLHQELNYEFFKEYTTPQLRYLVLATWNYNGPPYCPDILQDTVFPTSKKRETYEDLLANYQKFCPYADKLPLATKDLYLFIDAFSPDSRKLAKDRNDSTFYRIKLDRPDRDIVRIQIAADCYRCTDSSRPLHTPRTYPFFDLMGI